MTVTIPIQAIQLNLEYLKSSASLTFANLPIKELIPQLVQQAIDRGTRSMLRELKSRLTEIL